MKNKKLKATPATESEFVTSFNMPNRPYNPLFDRHLFSYFHNVNVIRILHRNKIVTFITYPKIDNKGELIEKKSVKESSPFK